MKSGWISLHRKLIDNPIFHNEKMLKIWIYCLLKATHQRTTQRVGKKIIELESGQFVFGRKKAAEELNMSESTVWNYVKLLEKEQNIVVNSNNKFSVVEVVNYTLYQNLNNENKQQNNSKITTNKQQNNTNNNNNNINNNYIYNSEKSYPQFYPVNELERGMPFLNWVKKNPKKQNESINEHMERWKQVTGFYERKKEE